MGARGSWTVGRLALGRLGFGGEEMPHRAPDVLEVVERVTAGGAAGRLQLREQLAGFGGQLPRQPRGHLHVAGETGVRGDGAERAARVGGVAHGVVAVGGIEQVDVAASGVVAGVDDLAYLGESGRGHGAAGAAHLEEVRLVEFPRLGGVRHEQRLERAVFAPQPLHDPEEEGLGELAIAVGHAARHVQHEEPHRVQRRLTAPGELAEAQILVDEGLRGPRRPAPLHQLLERAAPVEARACTMAVPALADPVGFLGRPHARLEVGQLHRLPQPVDDVVDLELEQQLHFALVAPSGSLFTLPRLAPGSGKHVPRLGLALARALLFLRAPQAEVIVLEHAHRHAYRAGAAVDDVAAGDDLGEIGAHRLTDFLVVTQPVARAARKQLVPLRAAGGLAAITAVFVHVLLVLLFAQRRYSWASSVVT